MEDLLLNTNVKKEIKLKGFLSFKFNIDEISLRDLKISDPIFKENKKSEIIINSKEKKIF